MKNIEVEKTSNKAKLKLVHKIMIILIIPNAQKKYLQKRDKIFSHSYSYIKVCIESANNKIKATEQYVKKYLFIFFILIKY